MSVLDTLREAIPPTARERIYVIAAAAVAVLASWGGIDAATVPAWSALVVSVITLGFAILHSTSTVRTALYSLLLAGQGVAQVYGIFSDEKWSSIVALAASVLGLSVAAAKTPTAITLGGMTVNFDVVKQLRDRLPALHIDYDSTPPARTPDPAPPVGGAQN